MKSHGYTGVFILLVAALFLILCMGCVPKKKVDPVPVEAPPPVEQVEEKPLPVVEEKVIKEEVPPPPPPPQDVVHMIQWSGETLSIIAKWYTGKAKNWRAIAEANPSINPNVLGMKTQILIPADMVVNRDPMPKEYLKRFYKKKLKKKPAPKPAPVDKPAEEDVELFGPKPFQTE